jgi:hypothetical protein
MSTWLLRQQNMLRDFKENRSGFSATRQKCSRIGVKRDLRCDANLDQTGVHFLRSTIFFFARLVVRDRRTTTRGSLHVSHLIHRL